MSLESHKLSEGEEIDNSLDSLNHRVAEGYADIGLHEQSEVDLTGLKKIEGNHIRDLYRDVLSSLEKEKEFTVELPDISFTEYSKLNEASNLDRFERMATGLLDKENYELILPESEKKVRNTSFERQKTELNLNSLFKFRFSQLTDGSLNKLSDIYGASANVADTRATTLDDSTGAYKDRYHTRVNQRVIEFDYSILNFLDLETGEVREKPKIPPGKTEEDMRYKSTSPGDISDHEVMHAIHFQNNPHVIDFSQHIGSDVAGGEENEYKKDVRRASIEAISTFEQELNHGEDYGLDSDFDDPFLIGDFLSMNVSPDEDLLYDDPYNLGKVTAFTIDAALRDEHGEEKGRELAREYLMTVVTSPTGLEGTVEQGLDMMGLPNFHENLRTYHDRILEAEDAAQELSEIGREVYSEFGEESLDTDEALEAHYQIEAAEAAYRELESQGFSEEYLSVVRDVKDSIASQRFGE